MRVMKLKPGRVACRYCEVRMACKTGDLCFECYRTPEVRALYPGKEAGRGSGRRGVRNYTGESPLPAAPCPHPAGSPERERTLCLRAERGERLDHPGDSWVIVERPSPARLMASGRRADGGVRKVTGRVRKPYKRVWDAEQGKWRKAWRPGD